MSVTGRPDVERIALAQAREELFDLRLYRDLAQRVDDAELRRVLDGLVAHERRHADFWLRLAGVREAAVRPPRAKRKLLLVLRRLLGVTFIIRWLERGEERAIDRYTQLLSEGVLVGQDADELRRIIADERGHEQQLEDRVGEGDERQRYLGSAVLGLNDALVELTGGLAGLASSIADTKLIAFSGLVVGVAAAFSMAASNFLSVDIGHGDDDEDLDPKKAAGYTGTAYILVVFGLVAPFFVTDDRAVALAVTWTVALVIIAAFSYYAAVVQAGSFRRRFGQMLALGLGVAVVTFAIGRILGATLGIAV